MANSAINTQVAQQKIGNVQNQADSSAVYSAGVWSFKNSTAVTSVTITDSGNVGIGTASPDVFGRFDQKNVGVSVAGASDNLAFSLNAGASAGRGAQIYMGGGGTRYFTISSNVAESTVGTVGNTPLRFSTNDTERMRIGSDGKVLVNASSSGTNEKLFVEGGARFSGSGTVFTIVGGGNNLQFSMPSSPTGAQILNSSGNPIDIVATSAGVRLVAGGTSWGAISDERKKKNIKPLEYGLEQVFAINPVRFDYLIDESDESARIGFTAQNLMTVIKESVQGDEESEYTVTPTDLIPVLVKAIQELSAKVDAQAAEIAALKAS